MPCSYPITIRDNKRGTDITPVFRLVPCGYCISCVQRKRADWSFRLHQEAKNSILKTFLTLTYDEKHKPSSGSLDKKELQKYFKRVRNTCKELKYYAVGEYGTKGKRPHYHAIVFNVPNDVLVSKWTESNNSEILKGFVSTDEVNEATIHYVTGYITKKYGEMDPVTGKFDNKWDSETLRPFALMSKGLGKIYLKHNAKYHKSKFTTETRKEGGQKAVIPRYYKDKIFTEEERKLLAAIMAEKIENEPIDPEVEFSKRQYNKTVIQKQILNKKL